MEMNTMNVSSKKPTWTLGPCANLLTASTRTQTPMCRLSAPQSIQDQRTEAISLSEQLLDEWSHRLKNNLQILIRLLSRGYRKASSSEAREVRRMQSGRIGAIGTAPIRAYYCARGSTDVNGQDLSTLSALMPELCSQRRIESIAKPASGNLPKETAMPLALIINELLMMR